MRRSALAVLRYRSTAQKPSGPDRQPFLDAALPQSSFVTFLGAQGLIVLVCHDWRNANGSSYSATEGVANGTYTSIENFQTSRERDFYMFAAAVAMFGAVLTFAPRACRGNARLCAADRQGMRLAPTRKSAAVPSPQPARLSRRAANSAATGVTITGKKRHYIDNGQRHFTVSPGLIVFVSDCNRFGYAA